MSNPDFSGDALAFKIFTLKHLAVGFLIAALILSLSNVVILLTTERVWIGFLSFLVLLIPLLGLIYLLKRGLGIKLKNIEENKNLAAILFILQGVALACWSFDNATTFYAINMARVATELNPLGWPLGAIGALIYYVPTIILTYALLFKLNKKVNVYAALGITAVTLYMGCININAGINNYKIFFSFAPYSITTEFQNKLITTMAAIDLIGIAIIATITKRQIFSNIRKFHTKKA